MSQYNTLWEYVQKSGNSGADTGKSDRVIRFDRRVSAGSEEKGTPFCRKSAWDI